MGEYPFVSLPIDCGTGSWCCKPHPKRRIGSQTVSVVICYCVTSHSNKRLDWLRLRENGNFWAKCPGRIPGLHNGRLDGASHRIRLITVPNGASNRILNTKSLAYLIRKLSTHQPIPHCSTTEGIVGLLNHDGHDPTQLDEVISHDLTTRQDT